MGNRNKKDYKFKIFRNQSERNIHYELLTFWKQWDVITGKSMAIGKIISVVGFSSEIKK